MDFKRAMSVMFFHDITGSEKPNMNITLKRQKGPYNKKQTSANAFIQLLSSESGVEVGKKPSEQMEGHYFLELQNEYVAYKSK